MEKRKPRHAPHRKPFCLARQAIVFQLMKNCRCFFVFPGELSFSNYLSFSGNASFTVDYLSFTVDYLSFIVSNVSFTLGNLSFTLNYLSFIVDYVSFTLNYLSFIVSNLSFTLDYVSFIVNYVSFTLNYVSFIADYLSFTLGNLSFIVGNLSANCNPVVSGDKRPNPVNDCALQSQPVADHRMVDKQDGSNPPFY